jgi:hypothetical protein
MTGQYIDKYREPNARDWKAVVAHLHETLTDYGISEGDEGGAFNLAHRIELLKRQRDDANKRAERLEKIMMEMVTTGFCESHIETIKEMSFEDFQIKTIGKCLWCCEERANNAEQHRDELSAEFENKTKWADHFKGESDRLYTELDAAKCTISEIESIVNGVGDDFEDWWKANDENIENASDCKEIANLSWIDCRMKYLAQGRTERDAAISEIKKLRDDLNEATNVGMLSIDTSIQLRELAETFVKERDEARAELVILRQIAAAARDVVNGFGLATSPEEDMLSDLIDKHELSTMQDAKSTKGCKC